MKEKNLSIELLKFFAVILVFNSHLDSLYGEYRMLATGGAIGDALFFFSSGFTLFLGRFGRFDNWYKRRIKRIYPSLIALSLFLSVLNTDMTISTIVFRAGGYWFINCIMVYYIILYFVRKYCIRKPLVPFLITTIVVLVFYCFEDSSTMFMYKGTYFRRLYFFFFMLAGAYIGNESYKLISKPLKDVVMLLISLVVFYGVSYIAGNNTVIAHMQVLTLIPLMGVVIYTYKLCCINGVAGFLKTRFGLCVRFIASICLESYIVWVALRPLVTIYIVDWFPLSLLIAFITTVVVAYIIRCLGRIISQIFEKEDFDWRAIIKIV